MRQIILLSLLSVCMFPLNSQLTLIENGISSSKHSSFAADNDKALDLVAQQEPGSTKMRAVVFKPQEYCRVELKDFEFDVKFIILSATVYFSGENFRNVEKATISSNSLKPIRKLMDRCVPGSIVVFDDIKVLAPEKQVRVLPGLSLFLY